MFSPVHPDSGIQYARERQRELFQDVARAQRALEAQRGRVARVGAARRAAGLALVRAGSRLLDECFPLPELARG